MHDVLILLKICKFTVQSTLIFVSCTSSLNLTLLVKLRACETLWSAREIAVVALSAERERHT